MNTYGLIGLTLGYSFSRKYFSNKFQIEGLNDCEYLNFELDSISKFPDIFKNNPNISGLNCTIPYKQEVMQYLDDIDADAKTIGAINTIKVLRNGDDIKLVGYNTDTIGFENSIKPLLNASHKKALVLGTGGASKAIVHVLNKLNIDYMLVSRKTTGDDKVITYADLTAALIEEHKLIINSTPLGTFPNVDVCPDIPYHGISSNHVLYDLVYNPSETLFLRNGKERSATIQNGLKMLEGQAAAAWDIWQR